MSTRCVYCGSTSFGSGCPNSPNECHKHSTDNNTCMYCGQSAYGSCRFSPNGRHVHGHSRIGEFGRCRYCGSPTFGSCSSSPSHKHEH